MRAVALSRIDAVRRDPRSDQVEAGLGDLQHGAGVRHVADRRHGRAEALVVAERLLEAGELLDGGRQVLLVAAGEVGVHALDVDVAGRQGRLDHLAAVPRVAESGHAGVDLQVHDGPPPDRRRRLVDAGQPPRRGGGQDDAGLDERGQLVVGEAAQHHEGRLHARGPQGQGLLRVRDGEPRRARADRGLGDRHQAVAVGVGLHDRHDGRRRHVPGDGLQVAAVGAEVDDGVRRSEHGAAHGATSDTAPLTAPPARSAHSARSAPRRRGGGGRRR